MRGRPAIRGYEISPPTGGWRIHIGVLGQSFTFNGNSTSVVKQIADIQKKNNVYEGEGVIWEYCNRQWCERDPKRCLIGETTDSMGLRQPRSKLIAFGNALKALVQNGLQPVDINQATERAKICQKCPYNRKTEKCGFCLKTAQLITKGLIGDRKTRYDRKLNQCSVCGCDLKAKIHYPLDEKDNNTYPKHCWVAKELKDNE